MGHEFRFQRGHFKVGFSLSAGPPWGQVQVRRPANCITTDTASDREFWHPAKPNIHLPGTPGIWTTPALTNRSKIDKYDRSLLNINILPDSETRTVAIWKTARSVLAPGKPPFWKGRGRSRPADHRASEEAPTERGRTGRAPPRLPTEIWRKVIGYTIRIVGSTCVRPEDSFSTPCQEEEYPEIDAGIFEDRRALARVCSTFRALVTEVCVEYVVIHRGEELEHVVRLLKRSRPNASGRRLGEKTLRIDLKIIGPYNLKRIAALLALTPNLSILVNHNNRATGTLGRLPKEFLRALATHGQHIRRLDFGSINEAPALHDIIEISESCRRLESLSLQCVHSYPNDPDVIEKLPIRHFKALRTLLLARIPRPAGLATRPPDYSTSWDPLLAYFSLSFRQLPQLERLEVGDVQPTGISFFQMHGRKLRMLKTSTWSVGAQLPKILELCTKLHSLVLVQGSSAPPTFPSEIPNIQRICITPYAEETAHVPTRIFSFALLAPLDELITALEAVSYGSLSELRIRNAGAYDGLAEHGVWLDTWWRRFSIRGVGFVDKKGCSYEKVVDPGEALLNSVRG